MNSKFIVSVRKVSHHDSYPLNEKQIEEIYKKSSSLIKKIEKTIIDNRTTGKQFLESNYKELKEVQKYAETFVLSYCNELREKENIDNQPFKSHYWNTLELLNIIKDAEQQITQLAKTYFLPEKRTLREVIKEPFNVNRILRTHEIVQIHDDLLKPFKVYGKVKNRLRQSPSKWQNPTKRNFEGNPKAYKIDKDGYGYVILEPKNNEFSKIELWHKIDQIHKLLINLKIHQTELLSAKNNLDNFQEIKRKIIGIVKELEKLFKVPIQQLEPKKQTKKEPINQNFDTVFISEESKLQTLEAAKKLGIINDEHNWIYGIKRKAAIMAIIDVLKTRGKLKGLPDIDLANIFATKFNTTISERTTRARPKYFTDLLRDLKVLII